MTTDHFKQLTVRQIVHEEDPVRVLVYGENRNYHVIASEQQVKDISIGDQIEYEEYGFNFGWFSRKL